MKAIYIAVFVIFAVIITANIKLNKYEQEVSRYSAKQDSLTWVINEMNKEIDFLDKQVGEAYAKKDSIEGVLQEVSARESSLRDKLNDVRDSLDNLTVSELQEYFDVNYVKQDSVPDVFLDSAQAVGVAVDLEQGKVNRERIDLLLIERKGLYQLVAEDMKIIISQEEIIDRQGRIIETQEEKLELAEDKNDVMKKQIKRERFKTKVVGGAGIAAVVLILIIL